MIIECDGDYWHNYPKGNEIDHIRTQLIKENGTNIVRLWEHEIKELTLEEFAGLIDKPVWDEESYWKR